VNRSICTIGTGYVGMASMVGLAELGWAVNGYDIMPERIRKLQNGVAPYREAGIEDALHKHLGNGRLAFFESLEEATRGTDLIIVAVGTPARDDGSADLSALYIAVEELAKLKFASWPTVVIRSTVPPGTSDKLAKLVEGWGELVYAPERGRGRSLRQAVRIATETRAVHLAQQCRIDQVRLERVSRAQDQLCKRNRQPVRRSRRHVGRCAARHRLRPPYRFPIPQPRDRLRRTVL
jgi:nucleotide sugar dehydrogenase